MAKDKLLKLVERRHPEYEDTLPHWNFLESCYEGGRPWFENNIFQYVKEGKTEFDTRVKRAYRFNHSREVVDLVNKYIFKTKVDRNTDDAPVSVKDFWKASTRDGLSIDQFMPQVSRHASTLGRIWVVVDNNSTTQPASVAEAKSKGVKTYAYIVPPQRALDMSYDESGNLNWILIHEVARDDADPLKSSGALLDRFRLWTKTDWVLYEDQGEENKKKIVEIERGSHGLGVVPVLRHDHIESDGLYKSPSLIGDIAYLDRAVANYLSNLDAIIQDQTFSQLAMPAQSLMPGEESYNKMIEMGTKRIFLYDGEGGAAPNFISPDVKQAELIVTVVKQIINEIYHTVGMAGERTKQDNSLGIDNSSGVAKAYDFERVNALLAAKADSLDRFEAKLVNLVRKWNGEGEVTDDLVKYPDSFDVRGLYDEFEIAEKLSLVDAPKLMRQEQMKLVVEKLFPRIAADLKEKMVAQLSDWPAEPLVTKTATPIANRIKQQGDPAAK